MRNAQDRRGKCRLAEERRAKSPKATAEPSHESAISSVERVMRIAWNTAPYPASIKGLLILYGGQIHDPGLNQFFIYPAFTRWISDERWGIVDCPRKSHREWRTLAGLTISVISVRLFDERTNHFHLGQNPDTFLIRREDLHTDEHE